MKCSHPDRWRYGGILQELRYEGASCSMLTWCQGLEAVEDGDTLVLLQSAHGLTLVDVRRERAVSA